MTDAEKAAEEQKLLVAQMEALLAARQGTTTTTTSAPPPSSTDTTGSIKPTSTDVSKLDETAQPSPLPTTQTIVVPVAAATWTLLSGTAKDVGIGASGLWVVGTNVAGNGYGLWRWVNGTWASMPTAGAKRIDIDAKGLPWIVDGRGMVMRLGSAWSQVGTGASDIGVGGNGAAWMIGNVAEGTNFGIYRYNATTLAWTKLPGNAVRVDVDPQGNAWVVNAGGAIYRWNGTGWVNIPGVSARDVGIGSDGSVFVTGNDNAIYRWSGSAWVKRSGAGVSISADGMGVPVVVNSAGQIYKGWK